MLIVKLINKNHHFNLTFFRQCHTKDDYKIARRIIDSKTSHFLDDKSGDEKPKEDSTDVAKDIVKEFPEEPTTCCMSGCANCVWLEYANKLSEYFKDGGHRAVQEINEKVTDQNIKAFLLQELRMRNKN